MELAPNEILLKVFARLAKEAQEAMRQSPAATRPLWR